LKDYAALDAVKQPVNHRYHSVAEGQAGFFTAKQQKKSGFSESSG